MSLGPDSVRFVVHGFGDFFRGAFLAVAAGFSVQPVALVHHPLQVLQRESEHHWQKKQSGQRCFLGEAVISYPGGWSFSFYSRSCGHAERADPHLSVI
jgi:hypothetical protein